MSRRSLATPIIIIVLVALATLLTFATAGPPSKAATRTSPGIPGKAAPVEDDTPVQGRVIERDAVSVDTLKDLVPALRRYQRENPGARRVVVVARDSGKRALVRISVAGRAGSSRSPASPGSR